MKIHPEMREKLQEEMAEGLRYWRDKSPEQIRERLHRRMVADQKALIDAPTKGLDFGWRYVGCDCGGFMGHYPWCNGKAEMYFFTPLKEKTINGRIWYAGGSGE